MIETNIMTAAEQRISTARAVVDEFGAEYARRVDEKSTLLTEADDTGREQVRLIARRKDLLLTAVRDKDVSAADELRDVDAALRLLLDL